MRKVHFYNKKSIDQNINTKRLSETQYVSKKLFEILDCTKIKIYYKTTIIKWRGSSVG